MLKKRSELSVQQGVSLKKYSTFQVGGQADYFLIAKDQESIQDGILWAKERQMPYLIIGKGSNSLFADEGFRGLIILNKIDYIFHEGPLFKVGAGYSFSRLGSVTSKKGYEGLEFACGIPASVGGAIYMNAGANGSETFDCLHKVSFIDAKAKITEFEAKDLQRAYRYSIFQEMQGAIIGASFLLKENDTSRQKQLNIIEYRKNTQPLKECSAGCIFKNPEGSKSAGQLIEEAGMKGKLCGDAQVSSVHANFIINKGQASAEDIRSLAEQTKQQVFDTHGVSLESEVYFIDQWGKKVKVCKI
ncbi:MAG: UDP-N-acetylmuramate dehydrogenase [Chlamydiales bacterium]|nr:UDP-N-acetylmuramate dehydrogenase [Chlamydiales bacterium]NCF70386.1 UDP-N-acetylmuramate dehydrogenase [Chlamydiales bacterium]